MSPNTQTSLSPLRFCYKNGSNEINIFFSVTAEVILQQNSLGVV